MRGWASGRAALSPLIFALVADILLRKLSSDLGERIFVRAFADDTAAVIRATGDLQVVFGLFEKYGVFTNLKLNLAKTTIIPLFLPKEKERANNIIRAVLKEADTVNIAWLEKYLGVYVGPEAGRKSLIAPTIKYLKAASKWKDKHLGLQYDVRVYCMFALSILQFYLQFHGIDDELKSAEKRATKGLFTGPGNWDPKNILLALKSQLNAPYDLPCVGHIALASKIRLIMAEPFLAGVTGRRSGGTLPREVSRWQGFGVLGWLVQGWRPPEHL